jgi:hypothetical protein
MPAKVMQKCSPFEDLICKPLDEGKRQATGFSLLHFAPLCPHHMLVEKIEQIGAEELKHEYDVHLAGICQTTVFEMVE